MATQYHVCGIGAAAFHLNSLRNFSPYSCPPSPRTAANALQPQAVATALLAAAVLKGVAELAKGTEALQVGIVTFDPVVRKAAATKTVLWMPSAPPQRSYAEIRAGADLGAGTGSTA